MTKISVKISLAFVGVGILNACMKDPELKPSFGPEVSSQEFSESLNQVEVPDPYTIKKDEYAYFIRSTVLQDQVYQLDKRWAYTVTDKTADATDYIITFVKETREMDGNQEKLYTAQDSVKLAKEVPASTVIAAATSPESLGRVGSVRPRNLKLSDFVFKPSLIEGSPIELNSTLTAFSFRPQQASRVTFHNLKMETTRIPVPEFVQQRADCGGLSTEKCRASLVAYVMTFDQVIWDGDQGQRYSVLWVFSPDVPYFGSTMFPSPAGVFKSCGTTQIPFQGQRVKVTQCDEIKDFTFGKDD